MKSFILLASLLLSVSAFAQTPVATCLSVDPLLSPVGTVCNTSIGIKYERVQNGWKDGYGEIWHDEIAKSVNAKDAEAFCADKGLKLPASLYFEYSANTIPEVYKDMTNLGFWTSDMVPDLAGPIPSSVGIGAFISPNINGQIYVHMVGIADLVDLLNARCVSPATLQ